MKNIVKIFIYLFAFLFANSLFAQNDFYFGLNYSKDYNYRVLKNESGLQSISDSIWELNDSHLAKTSNGFGFHVVYAFYKNFQIEVGYNTSNKGYRTEIDFSNSFSNPKQIDYIESYYNYRFADIPIRLNYALSRNQFILIPSIGITLNALTNAEIEKTTYFLYEKESEVAKSEILVNDKSLGYSYYLSFAAAYKITEKLSFRLEPFYSNGITALKEGAISTKFYNAGVNFGLYLKL